MLVQPVVVLAMLLTSTSRDWTRYLAQLISLANDPEEQKKLGFAEITRDWAIGTAVWKHAVARQHSHRALELDLPRAEIHEVKAQRWRTAFENAMRCHGKGEGALVQAPKGVRWKVEIARTLRTEAGAPYRWIAKSLAMGSPNSVRVAVCRLANM